MTVLEDLLAGLPADDAPVRQVLVGAHWTVVCSRYAGMAATWLPEGPHGAARTRDVGHLHERSARELAAWSQSDNLLEASIGVAAINSLMPVDAAQASEVNAADVLAERGRGRKVAIIGHFPFVERLRGQVGQLWVIEKRPIEGDFPAEAATDLLPQADLVAITASTLINHTLDDLLRLCSRASDVMLLGPSTPLSAVLFKHGVTIISGTRVVDEDSVLRTVAQGASFRQVEGVRLCTLLKPGEQ